MRSYISNARAVAFLGPAALFAQNCGCYECKKRENLCIFGEVIVTATETQFPGSFREARVARVV